MFAMMSLYLVSNVFVGVTYVEILKIEILVDI